MAGPKLDQPGTPLNKGMQGSELSELARAGSDFGRGTDF